MIYAFPGEVIEPTFPVMEIPKRHALDYVAVLDEQLKPLASALGFLANLGLMPIILHGAGPQLDVALQDASIPTVKRNGLRVTTPEVMEVARPVIYRANRRLVSALEDEGVRATGIQHGVFVCDYLDRNELGLVGDIQRIDLEAVRDAVNRGALPVVACRGESTTGQVMNINADVATRELALAARSWPNLSPAGRSTARPLSIWTDT